MLPKKRIYTYLTLGLGSILVATGFTVAGISMVRDSFIMVAIGFVFFVVGYKICWFAAHDITTINEMKASVEKILLSDDMLTELRFHSLTLTGIVMVSYGSTEFAQLIVADGQMNPIISGAITFAGYMISHEGVNRVLV